MINFSKKWEVKLGAALIIYFVVLAWVFGTALPFIKARSYIAAAKELRSANSIPQLFGTLDEMWSPYAPVGNTEVSKFMGNDLQRIVAGGNQNEAVTRAIVSYYEPLAEKGDPRQLLTIAQMYRMLWQRSGSEQDFRRAEQYFLQMNRIGPKLPQPLYSLLRMYTAVGATENAIRVAENITTLWPEDTATKETLRQLRASQ